MEEAQVEDLITEVRAATDEMGALLEVIPEDIPAAG